MSKFWEKKKLKFSSAAVWVNIQFQQKTPATSCCCCCCCWCCCCCCCCCCCRCRCRCHCCFRRNLKNIQRYQRKIQVSQARCIKAINSFRIKAVGPSSDEADAEEDSKAGRRPRLTYKLMRGSEMSLPKRSLYGMRRSNISYLFFKSRKKVD